MWHIRAVVRQCKRSTFPALLTSVGRRWRLNSTACDHDGHLRQLAFDFLRGKSSRLYVDMDLIRSRETDGESCSDLAPLPLQFEDCRYVCWLLRQRQNYPHLRDEVFVVVQDKSISTADTLPEPKILSTTFLMKPDESEDRPSKDIADLTDDDTAYVVIHHIEHPHQEVDKKAQQELQGIDAKEYSMNKLYDLAQLLRKAYKKNPTTIKEDSVSEALAKGNYLFLTFHLHYPDTKVFPKQQAVFVSKEDTKKLLQGTALAYLVDYFN